MSSTKVRTAQQAMRATARRNNESNKAKMSEIQGSKAIGKNEGSNIPQSRRETKIALQQDVDKLKKKLRQEESVHRALKRAFTRPLGALPRLSPYLPSHTLELLAEVAVLEEEVVRLEEQVVSFRQGLYQEAIYISSSKKTKGNAPDLCSDEHFSQSSNPSEQLNVSANLLDGDVSVSIKSSWSRRYSLDSQQFGPFYNQSSNAKRALKKQSSSLDFSEVLKGKENQRITNFSRSNKQSPVKKVPKFKISPSEGKHADAQQERAVMDRKGAEMTLCNTPDEASLDKSSIPNRLSEDILKCLMKIFIQISTRRTDDMETSSSSSGSCGSFGEIDSHDPYDICAEFGKREIGPYKHYQSVEVSSNNQKLLVASSSLKRKLKILLRKLESVDVAELTHQQKLAFWINTYNSCMMNAFVEQGIPKKPEMVAALMLKAKLNVGGQLLNAMTIEHFILRLPCHMKNVSLKGPQTDTMTIRGIFGLERPEPLVTFALSCGSWSSPALRIYTAAQVESALETAKRDYLQAAVGISKPNMFAIPKLLDWYLLDFAKDVESLIDWICLQLPSELKTEAVKCLEVGRRSVIPQAIQVLPYEFRFRYLLAPQVTLSPP